jgi:large subunit ribosomal protein L20
MPRAKGGPKTHRRHKKLLKLAKGFYGRSKNTYKQARQRVEHGLQHAYAHRRLRKREFRSLWIARINAAARRCELSYSRFMQGLKAAGIELDRKMLADLAVREPGMFADLAARARAAL